MDLHRQERAVIPTPMRSDPAQSLVCLLAAFTVALALVRAFALPFVMGLVDRRR